MFEEACEGVSVRSGFEASSDAKFNGSAGRLLHSIDQDSSTAKRR
jgi:hypothetical protein